MNRVKVALVAVMPAVFVLDTVFKLEFVQNCVKQAKLLTSASFMGQSCQLNRQYLVINVQYGRHISKIARKCVNLNTGIGLIQVSKWAKSLLHEVLPNLQFCAGISQYLLHQILHICRHYLQKNILQHFSNLFIYLFFIFSKIAIQKGFLIWRMLAMKYLIKKLWFQSSSSENAASPLLTTEFYS